MSFLDKLNNISFTNEQKIQTFGGSGPSSKKSPIVKGGTTSKNSGEISMCTDISDEQIRINQQRSRYITEVNNQPYKVKKGDSPDKIAKKYGIETCTLLEYNGLTEKTAKKIQIGQVLKIPPTKKLKNIRTLADTAKALGISEKYIKDLKKLEDDANLPPNKFHNTPYRDKAGVLTIGIGHALQSGEPRNLTDAQVCELLAKDLMKFEENLCSMLGGQKVYDKIPQGLKEALLDMIFNKGPGIIQNTPGLIYTLKTGKYEAAINKITNNKSTATGKEMSGLSKRRLYDLSLAFKSYPNGKIPQSNLNTAQAVYNRGIELLRQECKEKGLNFQNQLVGYNADVKNYLGDKIKLVTK